MRVRGVGGVVRAAEEDFNRCGFGSSVHSRAKKLKSSWMDYAAVWLAQAKKVANSNFD